MVRKLLWRVEKNRSQLSRGRKISETATHRNSQDGTSTPKRVDLAEKIRGTNVDGASCLPLTMCKLPQERNKLKEKLFSFLIKI